MNPPVKTCGRRLSRVRSVASGFAGNSVMLMVVLLVLWVPPFLHNFVWTPRISGNSIETARNYPSDEMLDQLSQLSVDRSVVDNREQVAKAEKALNGRIEIPKHLSIRMPFDARDLEHPSPGGWLFIASFGVPRLLLNGYEASGRIDFLRAATDLILGFAKFERNAWFPKGHVE